MSSEWTVVLPDGSAITRESRELAWRFVCHYASHRGIEKVVESRRTFTIHESQQVMHYIEDPEKEA